MNKTIKNKVRYAVVYDDEQWISTDYYSSPAAAIKEIEQATGEKWPIEAHSVQGFTEEEIKQIEIRSEAHPQ